MVTNWRMVRKVRTKLPTTELFFRHVDVTKDSAECWNWTGAIGQGGYGKFKYKGKNVGAHRVSWLLHYNKKIPKGTQVRHNCHSAKCVNPRHLYLI